MEGSRTRAPQALTGMRCIVEVVMSGRGGRFAQTSLTTFAGTLPRETVRGNVERNIDKQIEVELGCSACSLRQTRSIRGSCIEKGIMRGDSQLGKLRVICRHTSGECLRGMFFGISR